FFFFLGFLLDKVPLANLGNPLSIECVCAPFITDEPLGKNAVVSLLGVSAILPLGYLIASCLKPPGPLPRPLSPTVANVSRAILPFLTTFVVVLVCSVPVCNLTSGSLSIPSFSPTQFTPLINPFNPVSTPPSIPLKKPLILPVTDLITSPILFMTPVTLFFIPVTNPTVLFLIPFHFLDMKPPTEFIVLRVPLDKEPQAPLTPDQVFLALFTVLDLILDHFELINLPTEVIVARVFLFKFDYQFFTPDHVAFSLLTVPPFMDCHFLDIKLPIEFIVARVFLPKFDHQAFTPDHNNFAFPTVLSLIDVHFLDIQVPNVEKITLLTLAKFENV